MRTTARLGEISLELPFTSDGRPKPVIVVGGNGSGKTNLLSIAADALFEAAVNHYLDVVPGSSSSQRPWFRVVGGHTVSVGAPGSLAILQFEHDGALYFFKEKGGRLSSTEVSTRLPESLRPAAAWAENGSVKEFPIPDEQVKKIFDEGVYVYFPSSRAESPHWLNRESLPADGFDFGPKLSKRLRKPIFVERALEQVQQWLLSLIMESRSDIFLFPTRPGEQPEIRLGGDVAHSLISQGALGLANHILRQILGDPDARFVWMGRQNSHKLGIATKEGALKAPSVAALSAGQSTLLGIFGTILRYADTGKWSGGLPPEEITGICLVDEIDAHMHVDLQYRALPALIHLFPKVQFILSSHSPLFVLGMEKALGAEEVGIVDMPSGLPVQAEAYAEFGRALEALQDTKAFAAAITKAAKTPGKLLVLLEGETDPIYLQTAADLLGRHVVQENVEFAWVGAKDPKSGHTFHTGKDALNHTLAMLRAKPELVKRRILLLYDNDANKETEDYGFVYVRSMPSNPDNTAVEAGIENLLPQTAISQEMFNEITKKKRSGGQTITTTLDKMKLCRHICMEERDFRNFAIFAPVLDMIEVLAQQAAVTPSSIDEQVPGEPVA